MFDQMAEAVGRRSARDAAVARLTAAMDELSALPVDPAATRGNLAEVAVLERARSWASARQARVLAGLEVAEPADYDPDSALLPSPRASTPQEIALVLRVSTATVRGRLAVAHGLVEHFPQTLAAAAAGTLPWWQARRVLEETADLSAAVRAAVDRDLAAHAAAGRNPARFDTRLRAAILHADPAAAEEEHLRSLADRAVSVDPHPDGTVTVAATVTAETGLAVLELVDRLADTPLSTPPAGWPVEGRTADQRRADTLHGLSHAVLAGLDTALHPRAAAERVLTDLIAAAATTTAPGVPRRAGRRRRGQVLVTVSAETLLGISDAPGELDGHGPISAGHARRLAGAADTWRRLLTDPATGAVLDVGRTRYTPSTAIAEHVLTRSGRRCTRPGCPRRAAHLDHAQPWAQDGTTAVGNLTGLCVSDHRARHTGWTVTITEDGATTITTRHGFTATTPPHDHRAADRRPPDLAAPDRRPPDLAAPDRRPPDREVRGRAAPDGSASATTPGPTGHAVLPPVPPRPQPARGRPTTVHARLQALYPAAHTEFPTPAPGGVGHPDTGHGWLTDMHTYITTTHDRAREDRSPRLQDPPSPATTNQQETHPYGKDDPAPF